MYNFVAKAVLNIVKATSNQYFVFNIYILTFHSEKTVQKCIFIYVYLFLIACF